MLNFIMIVYTIHYLVILLSYPKYCLQCGRRGEKKTAFLQKYYKIKNNNITVYQLI